MEQVSITDATERLRQFLSLKGRAENTIKAYLTDAKMFWLEMGLDKLDLNNLESLAAEWLNSKRMLLAPKTSERRLTAMKSLGNAYKISILSEYSTPSPGRPQPHPLPDGVADIRRLLDVCEHEQHRILIAMTGLMGMRISEARSTRACDFTYGQPTVTIWGKGDDVRTIPVSPYAMEVMMPSLIEASIQARTDEPLIRVGDRSAREAITVLGQRARISRPISSHDLRATFATEAYRRSLDIRAVQELLGHATSKQTEVYILASQQAMRSAASIME